VILLDSAKLQEEDAEHKRKRHEKEGRKGPYPEVPLYTMQDAEACFPHFEAIEYKQPLKFDDGITVTLCDAGHVLGSSMIKVEVSQNGQQKFRFCSPGTWAGPAGRYCPTRAFRTRSITLLPNRLMATGPIAGPAT